MGKNGLPSTSTVWSSRKVTLPAKTVDCGSNTAHAASNQGSGPLIAGAQARETNRTSLKRKRRKLAAQVRGVPGRASPNLLSLATQRSFIALSLREAGLLDFSLQRRLFHVQDFRSRGHVAARLR